MREEKMINALKHLFQKYVNFLKLTKQQQSYRKILNQQKRTYRIKTPSTKAKIKKQSSVRYRTFGLQLTIILKRYWTFVLQLPIILKTSPKSLGLECLAQ
jgi:hypothetical protein